MCWLIILQNLWHSCTNRESKHSNTKYLTSKDCIMRYCRIVNLCLVIPILYWSFDTLENITLMEGTNQTDFNYLVSGRVCSCLSTPFPNKYKHMYTSRSQNNWVFLKWHSLISANALNHDQIQGLYVYQRHSISLYFPLLSVGWYLFRMVSGNRYLPRGSNENTLCITSTGTGNLLSDG